MPNGGNSEISEPSTTDPGARRQRGSSGLTLNISMVLSGWALSGPGGAAGAAGTGSRGSSPAGTGTRGSGCSTTGRLRVERGDEPAATNVTSSWRSSSLALRNDSVASGTGGSRRTPIVTPPSDATATSLLN